MDRFAFVGLQLSVTLPIVISYCFQTSTVQELNSCMQQYFPSSQTIPESVWNQSLATPEQIQQVYQLVRRIYMATNYTLHCDSTIILDYQHLLDQLKITRYKDIFCVIHEKFPPPTKRYFKHFWGYMILTNSKNVTKMLHHSVPHYETDGEVLNQAAYIFQNTKSRSLVVAGAARDAVIGNVSNPCQVSTNIADAAHNNRTMFHVFNVAIRQATVVDKMPSDFIQWHGMAETSCGNTKAFLSAGARGTALVYSDKRAPVNRIRDSFNKLHGGAETPAQSTCRLVATTNIFGRFINGVPLNDVCNKKSNETNIKGAFVHIEQKRGIRDAWDLWVSVINDAFNTSSTNVCSFSLLYICLIRFLYSY